MSGFEIGIIIAVIVFTIIGVIGTLLDDCSGGGHPC